MKKVELLSPAGNLEKLKTAISYGADAIFCGGKEFSLRAKANNFTFDDLKEAVDYANIHHAKIHVTVNIVPTDTDLETLDKFLIKLDEIGVHAIIVSSIYIMKRVHDLNLKMEVHVSTQQSVANSLAVRFFKEKLNVKRVVLARESNIHNIKSIIDNNKDVEIEVFIHGGMCSSFSGRCTLSNSMSNRDANKGGCAHSCRWAYTLYDNDKKISDNNIILASKDLEGVSYIKKLMDIGVDSFKIEGRMKSEYYIATVINSYRRLIDSYYNNKKINLSSIKKEIAKAENRITYTGFLSNNPKNDALLSSVGKEIPSQIFIGTIKKIENGYSYIEVRNHFKKGDKIEIFMPNKTIKTTMPSMFDKDGNEVLVANHPMEILKVKFKQQVKENTFIRLI